MWIIKRDGTARYFGPYEWEVTQRRAVRFATWFWAKQTARAAAETNSGVHVVRLVPKASRTSGTQPKETIG